VHEKRETIREKALFDYRNIDVTDLDVLWADPITAAITPVLGDDARAVLKVEFHTPVTATE
jgi:hypothetical protein